MHVHGHRTPAEIAKRMAPALALIGKTPSRPGGGAAAGKPLEGTLPVAELAEIVGHDGELSGDVYTVTIARPDILLKEMGATINARMGLNTWAAFYGSHADAVVAGDVTMRAEEVLPVLKALRASGTGIVAIHHHMTTTEPTVYFLHYWGRGPVQKLADGVRAAVNQVRPAPSCTTRSTSSSSNGPATAIARDSSPLSSSHRVDTLPPVPEPNALVMEHHRGGRANRPPVKYLWAR